MKLGGAKPMVVKSATKKKLMDLGMPQPVANELAQDRRWQDLSGLTAKEMYHIVWQYHNHNTTLGNLLENMALWYGIIVHHQGTRHLPPWMAGIPWSWGMVIAAPTQNREATYMRKLVAKYLPAFQKLSQGGGNFRPTSQIAINYTRYLNLITCKGCGNKYKPDKIDIYGETCSMCEAAYSDDGSYGMDFDESVLRK